MSVITISRGSFSGGRDFAVKLGRELGYQVISREDLSEEATKMGVPVGRLQTAMVRPPRVYHRMGRERELYLASMTSLLCERILDGDVIYHGHTGHLLLTGIPHILRIRVLANPENRILYVMQSLKLSREKAKQYIEEVDSDRDKWVRFLYNVDWHDPSHYDLLVHLDQLGIGNAASALYHLADLPDFKLTPATVKAIQNLMLASKARFSLATNAKTRDAEVKVTASDGCINVTYLPQFAEIVPYVPDILSKLPGCRDVRLNIARTNILWLQNHYHPDRPEFQHVLRLAKKMDAAVELLKIVPETEKKDVEFITSEQQVTTISGKKAKYTGGIEDDTPVEKTVDEDVDKALDELHKHGCSGGVSTVYGNSETLVSNLRSRSTNYSMMIIGKIFTEKSSATQTRLIDELKNLLSDHVKIPVVGLDELEKEVGSTGKNIFKLLFYFVSSAFLFFLVFTNQEIIMQVLGGDAYKSWQIVSIVALLVFVPLFAYIYGACARSFFKLLGLE